MHLQTAVESLNGLTPNLTVLDQVTHKMAQNAKSSERLSRKLQAIEFLARARSSVG
jgi:hypothetical protein